MSKPTKWHVHPAKTDQPGHPSSLTRLGAQWVAKDPNFLQADAQADLSFAGRTCHFVGFVMRQLSYLEKCNPAK